MTGSQKLDLERSKLAERMVTLSAKDDLTEAERTELDAAPDKVADLEVRYRAALSAEEVAKRATAELPVKDRELADVRRNATFANVVQAAIQGRDISGAELELRSAVEPDSTTDRFPLELLLPVEERSRLNDEGTELTTRAVNPSDLAEDTSTTLIGRLFRGPITSFFGLTPSQVPAGNQDFYLLQAGNTAQQRGSNSEPTIPASTALSFSMKAVATRAVMDIPTELTLAHPGAEAWLMDDLRSSVTALMEQQILTGNGTAPQVSGITRNLSVIGTSDTYLADANTAAEVGSEAARWVDGYRATTANEVRLLLPVEAYSFAGQRATSNNESTGLRMLLDQSGGVMATARLPERASAGARATNNLTDFIIYRSGAGPRPYAWPVWMSAQLIPDRVSMASKGVIRMTLAVYWNFMKFLVYRADNSSETVPAWEYGAWRTA